MAARKSATPVRAKAAREAPLTKKVLKAAPAKATARAHRAGFKLLATQLTVKKGWLVRVNEKGDVVERVESLMTTKLKKRAKRRA